MWLDFRVDTGSLVGRYIGLYTGKLEIFVGANVRINGCKALFKFMYSCVSCIWLCPLSQSCM